jgi:glycosyltransferase involved in cell wall biosynthesis
MAQFAGKGTRIGFPIFELDKFNDFEKHQLQSLDRVFVCSEWAKKIVLNNTTIEESNIIVVPLGVDSSIFQPSEMPQSGPTRFFNCGKWEIRKGHDILVDIFNSAFNEDDNVELLMMCENPFLGEKNNDWINYYKQSPIANKIRFIPRQKYHRDVYNIMRQVDVGVFPVRAEGWNLELLELLSCGKHVITTDYSGHTEFTNRNNSYIVETDTLVKAQDGIWFHGQGEWAELGKRQEDQIINHMRETHRLKQDSELELNLAGIETAIKFSWENTAREILNGI